VSRNKHKVSSELTSIRGQFEPVLLDWLAAPLLAVLAGVWTFQYVGTSINWDDLLYMNVSQYTTPHPWILNRYGHIYLQKFFFWLAGDAIVGTRLYWCFVFFSTCLLVYWCARILAGKKGYIVGAAAVLLFCSQPIFARQAGCTLADFTVMFLVTLGIFVYLCFITGWRKYRHLFIILLGLIFFWAVKSKETGICMAVLFFALCRNQAETFGISRFIRDVGRVCLGALAGSILLMALDKAFMGDAWFSVRPANIKSLLSFNIGEFAHDQKNESIYTIVSLSPLFPAFLLYLLAGRQIPDTNLSRHKRAAWLIPLAVLCFLAVAVVRARCGSAERHLVPAIPGICIWAAQFFRFFLGPHFAKKGEMGSPLNYNGRTFKKLAAGLLIPAAFIIVAFLMYRMPGLIKGAGWKSLDRFYLCAIMPLSTTVLVAVAAVCKKTSPAAVFVSWMCLFSIIHFPLSGNLTLLKQKVVAEKSR